MGDRRHGGSDADWIFGLAKNDVLRGFAGNDILTGGPGNDVFDFNRKSESGLTASTRDRITDFKHLVDDIDLKSIDANSQKPADQAFKFIGTQPFHLLAGELHAIRIDNIGTATDLTLIEGDTNGDGVADFQIELKGLVTLTKADFVL